MKRPSAAVFAGLIALAASSSAARAVEQDAICSRAVPFVEAFTKANAAGNLTVVISSARDAISAYDACASESRLNGKVEPEVHYDQVRHAQFAFALARALSVEGNVTDAIAALKDARSAANDVAEWVTPSLSITGSNTAAGASGRRNVRDRSQFAKNAEAVRDAADAELKKLGATASPVPAPSPSP